MRRARLVLLLLTALPLAAQPSLPLLEKISVDAPPASLQTTVRGAAQAVPPGAHVIAVNTQSGHYVLGQAAADGSFQLSIYAAPGDSILVKSDPSGVQAERLRRFDGGVIDQTMSELTSLHGTIVRAPEGLASPNAFVDSGTSDSFLPYWTMQGTVDKLAVSPGGTLTVDAALSVHTTTAGANPNVALTGSLIMLSRADGSPALDQNTFASALMTPTGLPIERAYGSTPWVPSVTNAPLQADGNRMRATFRTTIPAAVDLPAGYYRVILQFRLNGITGAKPQNIPVTTFLGTASRRMHSTAYLPIVKVGDPAPPRLSWTLLANTLVEGMRGLNAIEDRGRFSIVPRVTTASDRFVVPRGTHNIEPFALTIGLSDRGAPITPPLIPFRFPSGGLTATVRRPDGSSATIGPVPFQQIALFGPSRDGNPMENGGHITDPVRLTTRDARFDFAFEQEGRYTIALDGAIEDVWGNVWSSRSTYELDVAAPLLIESATLPGTPFETGNSLARGVRVVPPVPADVEIRVRFAPRSKAASMFDETVVTRANRFGYVPLRAFRFSEPGEYRVDIFASHRDASGRLWAGTQTFASAVADRAPGLVANGRRGTDDQQGIRPQWFSRAQIGIAPGRGHVPFAFLSGDVTWLENDDAAIPWITVQDVDGTLASFLRPAYQCAMPAPRYDELAALGEIPLKSCGRYDPHIDPLNADVWGYSYRSVQRPHVRVREEISDENSPAPYWRFNDLYALQSGNGFRGDLPNDFKFQFGAAVLRGNALQAPRYAIYGSLFVLVPDDDPLGTRTFPPFQGNGGGPSGGPLFTLKGKEIDLFFHPMGVRPGSILVVGETASFAGYSAPPLASKVEIVVTSPSGKTRTIRGQANRIGWFYDPSKDFVVSEAGLWRAKVTITFDGATSGGPVSAPFPTGDVLGTHEGELAFYVVDANAEPLGLAPLPPNASSPVTFTMLPPAGLTNIETHHTVTMPGFVLEEGSGLAYTYDRSALANDFPNLEEVDIVTISLYLSGTDASGKRRHFARQVVLNGETLHAPEQKAPQPKRRAVR